MNDDAAQCQYRYQVRNSHQRIHAVGQVPHDVEVHHTAEEDGDDVEHSVDDHPAVALQVFYGPFAVVAPAQDGRESK